MEKSSDKVSRCEEIYHMLLLMTLAGFFVLKGSQNLKGVAPSPEQAIATAQAALAQSGVSGDNSIPPGAPSISAYDGFSFEDSDDGSMGQTAQAVGEASSDSPETDLNETQANSGSDSAVSAAWSPPVALKGYNRVLNKVWDEILDVDYLSPSPQIQYMFQAPPSFRQDNRPGYNSQPWSKPMAFQATDPSAHFETASDDPRVPAYDQDGDGDDE